MTGHRAKRLSSGGNSGCRDPEAQASFEVKDQREDQHYCGAGLKGWDADHARLVHRAFSPSEKLAWPGL